MARAGVSRLASSSGAVEAGATAEFDARLRTLDVPIADLMLNDCVSACQRRFCQFRKGAGRWAATYPFPTLLNIAEGRTSSESHAFAAMGVSSHDGRR
jgi:hypothetical protein